MEVFKELKPERLSKKHLEWVEKLRTELSKLSEKNRLKDKIDQQKTIKHCRNILI